MAEESAKIKQVIINNRHTNYIINFKIDIASTTILEFNYNIAAVNGEFSSPSIKIDMGKENLIGYLISQLRYVLNQVNDILDNKITLSDFDTVYISPDNLISGANVIIFSTNNETDDMNRGVIEFMYVDSLSTGELYTIYIPIDIMPTFLNTFIKILLDKDIITEEATEEEDTKAEDKKEE